MAIIDPKNLASIRVAEKVGLHYEKDTIFQEMAVHIYAMSRTAGGLPAAVVDAPALGSYSPSVVSASRWPLLGFTVYATPAVMSSSISNEHTSWDVSNMMFGRVLDNACEVGRDIAQSEDERGWVNDLVVKIAAFGTYSPDVEVRELFVSSAQLDFWCRVLGEVATRIYERRFGNQNDQTWQVSTIWAAMDLARVLGVSSSLLRHIDGAA